MLSPCKNRNADNQNNFLARARCLSAGLRYLRLSRLPRHDSGPVPGENRSAASCLCTVLRRALYHYATRSPNADNQNKKNKAHKNKQQQNNKKQDSTAGFFFLAEPVAFRRVYGLESYSRTSGEPPPEVGQHHKSDFFSSSMADVALWLGPYMSISGKTSICTSCTRTKTVWKCRQITTNQTTHKPARRPANPPARLAFRQEKQQTRQTKGAGAQTKTPTKKICQRTQWFDHCIVLKNMRK